MPRGSAGHRHPGIDAYIAKAQPDFQPMLAQLREAVHAACPEVEETLKWSAPSFTYRGRILCAMASFKQHMSFGYWQHAEVMGADVERDGMGSYGRIRQAGDLPAPARLQTDIRRAMALIDAASEPGRPAPAKKPKPVAPEIDVPAAFAAALAADPGAKGHFDAFPPGQRREYITWIAEAKREDTRERRIAQAIEWLREGKRRNWKYEKC